MEKGHFTFQRPEEG